MFFRRSSIQSKIVFPYTALFAVVIVVTSFITINIVYRHIDDRIESQMERMAESISNMGFLLTDDLSRNISEVIGADIIAYKPGGEVRATNLQRDGIAEETLAVIESPEVEQAFSQSGGTPIIRNIRYKDQPYKVTYRQLTMPGMDEEDLILSLISPIGDIAQAKRHSAISIALVALYGILLVGVVGIIIARNITAPVKQLVSVTGQIARGDLTVEAEVKARDEIGALANSFNQMTRDLKISRDKLVQSEKLAAVGQIAAGVAHDIRNPLTSIKMIVQLLKRRLQGDSSSQESMQAVLDEIDRLEITINGLLDFARPMELVLEPANIAHIVDDVIKIMEADLRHRKIELAKHIDENLPEVMLDSNRMKQVFMNVILNSMQAMPDGGQLTVKCHYDDARRLVQLGISDTGVGMSQEVIDRAFEPFFSTKPDGTGLGLANVKKIIELHNGNIQIKSVEGQGTEVIIAIGILL